MKMISDETARMAAKWIEQFALITWTSAEEAQEMDEVLADLIDPEARCSPEGMEENR